MIEGTPYASMSLEDICKKSYSDNPKLFNQAGQFYNHIHFWKWMKPGGGGKKLPGKLEAQINKDLGSFDAFRTGFIQAGKTQFGSGWAWLALKGGKLVVMHTPNGENPLVQRRQAAARRRRMGAFLLHRLPQRPAEIPGDLVRQPRQLGLRRRALRRLRRCQASLSDPLPRRGRQPSPRGRLPVGAEASAFATRHCRYLPLAIVFVCVPAPLLAGHSAVILRAVALAHLYRWMLAVECKL